MRAHGTRACYVFGPEPGQDRKNGCRCEQCKGANRAYARERDRATRRPDEKLEPAYVDATPARIHLKVLSSSGLGRREVHRRSGVSQSVLHRIKNGEIRGVRPATLDAILKVSATRKAPAGFVEAAPTWALVDELIAAGVTKKRIGQAITGNERTLALQLRRDVILQRSADAVARLHADVLHRGVLAPVDDPEPDVGTPEHFRWFLRHRRAS